MIFHHHQTIFFHIGKTAGSSIEKAFDPTPRDSDVADYKTFYGYDPLHNVFLQHATPQFMQAHIPPTLFSRYFKFTVVRNPYARILSVYHYLEELHQRQYGSFEQFIHRLPVNVPAPAKDKGSHQSPQFHYALIDQQPICDTVLFFEELPRCFMHIKKAVGLKGALDHHNRNTRWHRKPTHQYFSQAMCDIVCEVYEQDFALFGYSDDPRQPLPKYSGNRFWPRKPSGRWWQISSRTDN